MPPSIDQNTLTELLDNLGAASLSRIIEVFLDELDAQIDEIRSHLATREFALIANLAHTIKSTTATFGATDLTVIAEMIETAAKTEEFDALASLVKTLHESTQAIKPHYSMYTE